MFCVGFYLDLMLLFYINVGRHPICAALEGIKSIVCYAKTAQMGFVSLFG